MLNFQLHPWVLTQSDIEVANFRAVIDTLVGQDGGQNGIKMVSCKFWDMANIGYT